MAKLFSSLLVAMVGCWLIMASSIEGAYFPFYYIGSSSGPYLNPDSTADAVPVAINNYDSTRLNRPISLFSSVPPGYITDDPTTINGRTFQAFANIFAGQGPFCRPCPTLNCPSPTCPVCQKCQTCPTPATPADGALFIPTTTGCKTAKNSLDATLTPCTRASAAPKGTIEVIFTATTTSVIIGILGATPTTAIKLTCTSFPTSFLGVTQFGSIAPDPGTPTITGFGFVQFLASSGGDITAGSLKCTWST